jgi:multidrug efflux pump subunit AcrB
MEIGETPRLAAEQGGTEVSLAVLAATFTTSIVFFPVTLFYGVSRYLFIDLALGVVLSIFASYIFAMTVVPLYCAHFVHLKDVEEEIERESEDQTVSRSFFHRFLGRFNELFHKLLGLYEHWVTRALARPGRTTALILGGIAVVVIGLFPFIGTAYFPRTDPGQFVVNVKAPSGSRLEVSNQYIARVENDIRQVIGPNDLGMIVSNIGITPDLSAMYTSNSSTDTAFVQVSLKEGHAIGSYEYMRRVRRKLAEDLPELNTYFQAGGLVDSVINLGLPAPIDVQVRGNDLKGAYEIAADIARQIRSQKGVSSVLIPQNLLYPGLQLNIDRERASLIGLSPKVVDNVITALTSNGMIEPSYWIDPKTGNNYMLTVQYFDKQIQNMSMEDFKQIPLRAAKVPNYTPLQSVADITPINTPTEVDHYQLQRVIDIYVMPTTEALGGVNDEVNKIVGQLKLPENLRVSVRGSVVGMQESFKRFSVGLVLAIVLVYLVLMAQFASFIDPLIILMAIPPGLAGVVITLWLTHTTFNIMSLMGVIMMTGIVVSNSILIVEFVRQLRKEDFSLQEALVRACKIRLRPILMTSLATLLGMLPMALGIETGSEQYAPLARAVIGGLAVSVVVTVFLVPAVYLLIHGKEEENREEQSA